MVAALGALAREDAPGGDEGRLRIPIRGLRTPFGEALWLRGGSPAWFSLVISGDGEAE
jgi:hypothetical protein